MTQAVRPPIQPGNFQFDQVDIDLQTLAEETQSLIDEGQLNYMQEQPKTPEFFKLFAQRLRVLQGTVAHFQIFHLNHAQQAFLEREISQKLEQFQLWLKKNDLPAPVVVPPAPLAERVNPVGVNAPAVVPLPVAPPQPVQAAAAVKLNAVQPIKENWLIAKIRSVVLKIFALIRQIFRCCKEPEKKPPVQNAPQPIPAVAAGPPPVHAPPVNVQQVAPQQPPVIAAPPVQAPLPIVIPELEAAMPRVGSFAGTEKPPAESEGVCCVNLMRRFMEQLVKKQLLTLGAAPGFINGAIKEGVAMKVGQALSWNLPADFNQASLDNLCPDLAIAGEIVHLIDKDTRLQDTYRNVLVALRNLANENPNRMAGAIFFKGQDKTMHFLVIDLQYGMFYHQDDSITIQANNNIHPMAELMSHIYPHVPIAGDPNTRYHIITFQLKVEAPAVPNV